MSKGVFLLIALCSAMMALAEPSRNGLYQRPLAFEPNQGQAPEQVSWTARGENYQLFLTSSGATITMAERVAPSPDDVMPALAGKPRLLRGRVSAIEMKLVGSHPWSSEGLQPTGAVSNYLVGTDRTKWHSGIPQYGQIRVKSIYDGIDLVFYGHGRDLEYDFVLAPGADPNQIRLAFDGAEPLHVDEQTGDLVIKTKSGLEMRHMRPRVYQQVGNEKKEVAGSYQMLPNGEAAFRLAGYDRRRALVVDPTVRFTTFIEGNSQDTPYSIAVDAKGNSYITGQTLSTDFPNFFHMAPAKDCYNGVCPAYIFVTEVSPSGMVMNSTLIGGFETDQVFGIAVDSTGVWVAGYTDSNNFSTHTEFGRGYWNGFVAKLSVDLSIQEWCVTFGGVGDYRIFQGATAIAVDGNHNAYVTGGTMSIDYPTSLYTSTTMKPKQKSLHGAMNAFVTKVGADGYLTGHYSTYLGGSGLDIGNAIVVDGGGHAFIAGETSSADFPTNGATSHGSPGTKGRVGFAAELASDGSSTTYSVLLGGTRASGTTYPMDSANAIALDSAGEAYIVGTACSSDFPTTAGAFQARPQAYCEINGGDISHESAFAAKLSNTGTLLHATYLSGITNTVNGYAIAINGTGDIYVAGVVRNGLFPGAVDIPIYPSAGFLSQFDSNLETLKFSQFLGAAIYGITVFNVVTTGDHFGPLNPSSVLTTGVRYRPGTSTLNINNLDAFIVELVDTP